MQGHVDPYIIIFATLAVVVCLCLYSVLGQRTGSERPFQVSAFTYRLSWIAAVLCAVNYVAYEAKWYAAIEALVAPVAVPTEPSPVADSVPIYPTNYGTKVMIDVQLGVQPLRMLLDTGATTCLISDDIAAKIVRDGFGVWQGDGRFRMADDRIRTLPVLLIKEARIGRHTVRTVRAGVSSTGEMLLAFPVVNAIAPFTIDTRAKALIFHTASNSISGSHIAASTAAAPSIGGPARIFDRDTVIAGILLAMALLLGAALVLSFLHWKDWKAQKPEQPPPKAGDWGLLHWIARQRRRIPTRFRHAASREVQRTGRYFARKTGRTIVYLASMAISFAMYREVEPFVSRWQFGRDGQGWLLLLGMALAAALIFFILELCGVYLLSGRPVFIRRKRRWR
jgi:hypothetical protein